MRNQRKFEEDKDDDDECDIKNKYRWGNNVGRVVSSL